MRTLSVILAITSLITINLAGNSPDYDFTYSADGGDEGECRFKGTISTRNYACQQYTITRSDFKQNADLTWKILTKACPELIYAGCGDPSWAIKDHNMDELVWRDCSRCPRCPCNAGNPAEYYIHNTSSVEPPFKKSICYECKCTDWFENDNNQDIYARWCDDEVTYNDPVALQLVNCPKTTPQPTPQPTGGCDDGAGNSRAPGEYFFIFDSPNCDTYCTCNSTNGLECETSWDNIIASEELKYEFWEDCGYYLQDAFNDTSRYGGSLSDCTNNQNLYTPAGRCPRATCGTYSNGNKWKGITYSQTLYDSNNNVEDVLYNCGDCECDTQGNFAGLSVMCDTYDADVSGSDQCTVSDLTCEDYNSQAGFVQCDEGGGEIYCGWDQSLAPEGFDPDTVCIEDRVEKAADWGCKNDFECDAFYGYDNLQESSIGFCSYNELKFTAKSYDCVNYKWLSETYRLDQYNMCCKKQDGSNIDCNAQPIITSTALGEDNECKSNSKHGAYMKNLYQCYYGNRGVSNKDFIKEFECNKDLPEGKYDSDKSLCNRIETYWKYNTACTCKAAQTLEKAYPNDEYHDNLRQQLQLKVDSAIASTKSTVQGWAEAYECGSTFECDVTDKAVNNKLNLCVLFFLFIAGINYML